MKVKLKDQWQSWADLPGLRWSDPTAISTALHQQEQVYLLAKHTELRKSDKFSIIEIGPHNAVMAEALLRNYSDKIERLVLVDGAPMLEKCRARLSEWAQVEYYTPEQTLDIEGNFDLLVSCHCLAETTRDYQNHIYTTFFPACNEVFILQTTSAGIGNRGPGHANLIEHVQKNFAQHEVITPVTPSDHTIPDHQKLTWAKK